MFITVTDDNSGAKHRVNITALVRYKARYEQDQERGSTLFLGAMLHALDVRELVGDVDQIIRYAIDG
jgi:hypothetical protein